MLRLRSVAARYRGGMLSATSGPCWARHLISPAPGREDEAEHAAAAMTGRARDKAGVRRRPGSVRIIGGRWRGRRIAIPAAEALRPTTDRIRETLFNWLQHHLAGKRVADLFSGTGILGFEALSRGAASVLFVEQDRRLAAAIDRQLTEFGRGTSRVLAADVYELLAKGAPDSYDLVFLDPPYRHGRLGQLCTLLRREGWLAEGALVYLEHDRRSPPELPAGFELHREKTAGEVRFALLRAQAVVPPGGQS